MRQYRGRWSLKQNKWKETVKTMGTAALFMVEAYILIVAAYLI